jgi:hypothetical protein
VIGNKRVLALRKQLKGKQLHVVWVEQHLQHSRQLNNAQLCVLECVVECAVVPTFDAAIKKSDAEAPLSL